MFAREGYQNNYSLGATREPAGSLIVPATSTEKYAGQAAITQNLVTGSRGIVTSVDAGALTATDLAALSAAAAKKRAASSAAATSTDASTTDSTTATSTSSSMAVPIAIGAAVAGLVLLRLL